MNKKRALYKVGGKRMAEKCQTFSQRETIRSGYLQFLACGQPSFGRRMEEAWKHTV